MMKKYKSIWIYLGLFTALLFVATGCGGSSSSSGSETFTISGTISAPDNTAIDSDVNETNVTPVSNNFFDGANAQSLPNPFILGGYVNQPLSGNFGNSYLLGDSSDVFQVTLTENESITLYIADYVTADFDLYLYGENPDPDNPLDGSTGESSTKSLQAPSAGTYYIEVYAYSGASNYILTTGQTTTEATVLDSRIEDEFVPGEIIVQFREDAQESFQRSLQSADASVLGLKHKAGAPQRDMLLGLDHENRQRVFRTLNIVPTEQNRQLYQTDDSEKQLKLDTLRAIEALKKRPDVVYAEPNYMRHAFATPDDTHYPKQWHYPLISLPEAWEITKGNSDVIVAVVDTGILSGHPDFKNTDGSSQIIDGYDFIRDTDISVDGDGIDDNPEDPGDEMQGGSSFHGTHVAGTIAAATDNAKGVSGVSWNSKIIPLRALGKGGGTVYDIRQAIRYAAGLPNDSDIILDQPAHIINLSLGGSSRSDEDQSVITMARKAGVIIIAAAGNEATDSPSYPAAYEGVISVSAIGADKNLASYSNFGTTIDITAPGGNHTDGVLSTSGDDTSGDTIQMVYDFASGTSMAAPHVAGVAALMKSVYDELTPEIMDTLIQSGNITEDLGSADRDDDFGHGLINAYKAVIAAQRAAGGEIPALMTVSPLSLNFGRSETSLTLTVQNFGDEALTDVTASADTLWLDIAGTYTDPIGNYTITVDRADLDDGPYSTTITLTSNKNTVQVSVSMQVGNPAVAGNAGYHYVLLIDSETFDHIDQFDVAATSDGTYPFNLQAPAGNYILFAGSDSDDDEYIGDPGESTGAYISLDQPVKITLDRDLSGYDFTTSFNLNLPTMVSAHEGPPAFPIRKNENTTVIK